MLQFSLTRILKDNENMMSTFNIIVSTLNLYFMVRYYDCVSNMFASKRDNNIELYDTKQRTWHFFYLRHSLIFACVCCSILFCSISYIIIDIVCESRHVCSC